MALFSVALAFVPFGWRRRRLRSDARESAPTGLARRARTAGGRIVISVEKALDVRAPLRDVFGAVARVENLPQILPHLREVREVAVDRHHWVVAEPDSAPIEWDTVMTKFGANQIVAWESPPGSLVRHSGCATFRSNADHSTRVNIKLSYVLPPGSFGERAASLLGANEVDEALRRWKLRIEDRSRALFDS